MLFSPHAPLGRDPELPAVAVDRVATDVRALAEHLATAGRHAVGFGRVSGAATSTGEPAAAARADRPSRFSFIGVTTGRSAIMRVFPVWAHHLGLGDVVMRGHDLPIHAEPARYREVVSALGSDPLDLGGLVTTHKLDLYAACRDLFDYVDPYADLCREVSCLSKADGLLRAHAKDPISCGRAMDEFVPVGYWSANDADALLFGAGGSNLAITLHLMSARAPGDRPRRIVVVERSAERLGSMRGVHSRLDSCLDAEYVENEDPRENDRLVAALPPGSLVVNGTGMGKDIPGSPITDAGRFPERGVVWELNYRGELGFLRQARAQEHERELTVEDGWRYFVHGWTAAIEEVFHVEIAPATLDGLASLALPLRAA